MPRKLAAIPAPLPLIKPLVVSRKVAAALLGVDIQTVDGLISSGRLKASRLGKPGSLRPRIQISITSLERLLDTTEVMSEEYWLDANGKLRNTTDDWAEDDLM